MIGESEPNGENACVFPVNAMDFVFKGELRPVVAWHRGRYRRNLTTEVLGMSLRSCFVSLLLFELDVVIFFYNLKDW